MAETAPTSVIEDAYRSAQKVPVRAAAAVTTSYVASNWIRCAGVQWISLDFILAAWATSTSVDWKIEWSQDATTAYNDTAYAISGGVSTLAAASSTLAVTAAVNWNDGPIRVRDAYFRVSVKSPAVTTETVAISATLFVDKTCEGCC